MIPFTHCTKNNDQVESFSQNGIKLKSILNIICYTFLEGFTNGS